MKKIDLITTGQFSGDNFWVTHIKDIQMTADFGNLGEFQELVVRKLNELIQKLNEKTIT